MDSRESLIEHGKMLLRQSQNTAKSLMPTSSVDSLPLSSYVEKTNLFHFFFLFVNFFSNPLQTGHIRSQPQVHQHHLWFIILQQSPLWNHAHLLMGLLLGHLCIDRVEELSVRTLQALAPLQTLDLLHQDCLLRKLKS